MRLILTKGENVNKRLIETMKKLNKNLIVILSARSYSSLEKDLTPTCNKKECFFLDTVSPKANNKNVVYVAPGNLTGLSIAINQAQQPFQKKVCVIFDSFSSLMLQNDIQTLTKFVSFIITRAQDWAIDLVFILPNEKDNSLISMLKQSADKIEVKG